MVFAEYQDQGTVPILAKLLVSTHTLSDLLTIARHRYKLELGQSLHTVACFGCSLIVWYQVCTVSTTG